MITKYIETEDFVYYELDHGGFVLIGQDLVKAIQNHPKVKELYEEQCKTDTNST